MPVAAVVLPELGRETITDERGRFRLMGVPAGAHVLEVRRLGYDLPQERVEVPDAAAVELEVRVAPQVLTLSPIVVRTHSEAERARRASPHSTKVLAGERLRFQADIRGAPVAEIVCELPGLQVTPDRWFTLDGMRVYGPCIQSPRRTRGLATRVPCQMVEVVFDGALVGIGTAPQFLRTLDPRDLESVEFLPPMAAMRWGIRAMNNGALVIWSRGRGPYAERSGGGALP